MILARSELLFLFAGQGVSPGPAQFALRVIVLPSLLMCDDALFVAVMAAVVKQIFFCSSIWLARALPSPSIVVVDRVGWRSLFVSQGIRECFCCCRFACPSVRAAVSCKGMSRRHPRAASIAGEAGPVFAAIEACHQTVHAMGCPRVAIALTTRPLADKDQSLDEKVAPMLALF
jgi:uncharacterized protein YqgV (UPF0045/DUF77 family)